MNSKIVIFIYAMGMVTASVVPVAHVDPLPQYSYGYDVHDTLTGDFKGHQEHRNGDIVTGSYSVVDPDGTRRIVDYVADPINGFNAIVRREPLVVAAPARVVAPAPVLPPTPILARGPVFGPAPAPLIAPRYPSPYFF